MANRGGPGWDISFTPGTLVLTNTGVRFRWVCGDASAPTSYTPNIPSTLTMTRYPVGIVQSTNLSASSAQVTVRVGGVSAAECGATVAAFEWVKLATNGTIAHATMTANAGLTATTSGYVTIGIVGQPLESGVTLSIVEMLIRPYLSTYGME